MWCRVTNWKRYICTSARPLWTKIDRVLTKFERLQFTDSHVPLIMWSHNATWQNKASYLYFNKTYKHQTWQSDDSRWGTPTWKVTCLFDHVFTWCHVTNLKGSNLAQWSIRMRVSHPQNHIDLNDVVTWYLVKNYKHSLSSSTASPIINKLGRLVI